MKIIAYSALQTSANAENVLQIANDADLAALSASGALAGRVSVGATAGAQMDDGYGASSGLPTGLPTIAPVPNSDTFRVNSPTAISCITVLKYSLLFGE